jgi:hypothetical protein
LFSSGRLSVPPAASACFTLVSTSGTFTTKLMGEPPSVCGLTHPISGCSSASMIVEPPMRISAWPTRPSESVIRAYASWAPKRACRSRWPGRRS